MNKVNASIDIFSDISYSGYQHVNQMLFEHIDANYKNLDVNFYHRFYMRMPSLLNLFFRVYKKPVSQGFSSCVNNYSNVIEVRNFPSEYGVLDSLNCALVKNQLQTKFDNLITFVPSKSLSKVNDLYENVVYYCVHDSDNQEYSERNKEYEKELVNKSNIVLCDNKEVLNRLSDFSNFIDVANFNYDELVKFKQDGYKYYYVSPPTPNVFFNVSCDSLKLFDLFYYGSIHKDIDQEVLKKLSLLGYEICIMSSSRLDFDSNNITYVNPSSNLDDVVDNMEKCRAVILPYANSKFMETVSPAKINQSLASGFPIFCSNDSLIEKYELFDVSKLYDKKVPIDTFKMNLSYFATNNVQSSIASELMDKITKLVIG